MLEALFDCLLTPFAAVEKFLSFLLDASFQVRHPLLLARVWCSALSCDVDCVTWMWTV